MKIYNWGFFFEDGNKASIELPFGPVQPDNLIYDLDDEWINEVQAIYPDLISSMDDMGLPFAFVIVNPPVEKPDDYKWQL